MSKAKRLQKSDNGGDFPEKIKKNTFLYKTHTAAVLIVGIFSFLLYAQTISYEYALDDTLVITKNNFTKQGFSGIDDILLNDQFVGFFGKDKNLLPGGRYRPLSQVTFAIEYEFFELAPGISHLINVFLYAIAMVLLYFALQKIFLATEISNKNIWFSIPFWATILYAAHPVHTEIVANIKGRDEIMALFFIMITMVSIFSYMDHRKILKLCIALIAFFLALLSKETAATFLFIIPLTIYYFRTYSLKDIIRFSFIPLLFVMVGYLILRNLALGNILLDGAENNELLNDPYIHAGFMEKLATIIFVMALYLKLIFLPHPLTHDYYPKQIPLMNIQEVQVWLAIIIYVFLLIIVIRGIRKKSVVSYAILFFLITISLASNILFNIGTFMNERFLFIPSLGFTILLAYIIINKLSLLKKFRKSIILLALFLILIPYSIKTISRNTAWRNDFTLFTTDVKVSTNSAKVNVSAGGALVEAANKETDLGKRNQLLKKAVFYLKRGVEIHPKYIAGWLICGNAYLNLKNYGNALICYHNCLKLSSEYSFAIDNMSALSSAALNDTAYEVAIEANKLLIAYDGKHAEYFYRIGLAYYKNKWIDSARFYMENAIALDSTYYKAYNKLGEIYGRYLKDEVLSLRYLEKAYSIAPTNASVLENLGIAYGLNGFFEKSLTAFQKALVYTDDSSRLYNNIAGTYLNMGDQKNYQKSLQKSKESKKK